MNPAIVKAVIEAERKSGGESQATGLRYSPELEAELAEVEAIPNEHRRRQARAKLMARCGRWVSKNEPRPLTDKDGNKLPPRGAR